MATLEIERRVKAPRDLVWRVISDIAGIASFAPHISRVEILEGQQLGMRCRFYGDGDQLWDEECTAWEDGWAYSMRVDSENYPFSISSMEYSIAVEELKNGILLKARYEYQSKFGLLSRFIDRTRFHKNLDDIFNELMEYWIRSIHAKEWIYHNTVATLLETKGREVVTAMPETPVKDVIDLLAEHRIGSVLIVDNLGKIVGLLSERDIVRHLAKGHSEVLTQPSANIMSDRVVVCHPEDNMLEILSCMSERRFRHLPVVDANDQLQGIVSIGDVVKTRLGELEAESESLRHSIETRRWHELYNDLGPAGLQQNALASGPEKF